MGSMEDPLGLPMSRDASGTSWQPDSTPVLGHHFTLGDWMLMLHYIALTGYDAQGGHDRGDSQWMSANWVMLMAQRNLLGGQLVGRLMLSAEPLTTGGKRGYPLLLQTGETADGLPLHDRQHPHDLFMEVAVRYRHALSDSFGLDLYLAASGEPALGPTAFPHRVSASANPFAALGHHWQDSSHIAFGVLTAGIYTRRLKLEGSWFNGREPDENRYNFDFRTPDSYSARLTYNPTDALSFQVSFGYLDSPEGLDPKNSVRRTTASVTHNARFDSGNWATTAVFGHNEFSSEPTTNAALLESNLEIDRNTIFGRVELVQRTGHDLVLAPPDAETVFSAGVLEFGYVRDLPPLGPISLGIGAVGAAYLLPAGLQPYYGTRVPLSGMVFLRLRPAEAVHSGHHHPM